MSFDEVDLDSDSDCLVIDEEEKPKIDTLLIKKGPHGYMVEKNKTSDSFRFYMVPASRNESSNTEKSTQTNKNSFEDNGNFSFQEVDFSSSTVNQDPFVDSTNNSKNLEERYLSIPNDLNLYPESGYILPNSPNYNQVDSSSKSSLLHPHEIINLQKEGREMAQVDTFGINSSTLDPLILTQAAGGGYFVKDCFFGERHLSEVDELSQNLNTRGVVNYSDLQLDGSIEERLYSNLVSISQEAKSEYSQELNEAFCEDYNENSKENDLECDTESLVNNSQATTISVNSVDLNDENCNENLKTKEVLEDGCLVVINRSNSDVVVAGYD